MKYDDLKPRQQEFIQKLYEGLLNESVELEEDFQIHDEYTRTYLRYMSSKYAMGTCVDCEGQQETGQPLGSQRPLQDPRTQGIFETRL